MRIVCLCASLGSGGAERQMTGLAVLLKKQGHDVLVLTYYSDFFYRDLLVENAVDYLDVPRARNKMLRVFLLRRQIRAFRPDWVISYGPSASMAACLIRMLGGGFKLLVSERSSSQRLNSRERLRFALYRLAACRIVANSYTQTDFICQHFPSLKARTGTIVNFCNLDQFSPKHRCKPQFQPPFIKLIGVGRILKVKNILSTIQGLRLALDRGAQIAVRWYGETEDPAYRAECERMLDQLSLRDHFIFAGVATKIRDCYVDNDALIMSSFHEGCPNAVCEALCCGLPILASRVCDNPKLVREGENGFLFSPHSPEEIADAMLRLAGLTQDEKMSMCVRNRRYAETMFSPERFTGEYEKLLHETGLKTC
ncbi:MAG: glycosyltransferase family 4 protein [Lentisphaeria bacterium]|nr:glycosyltransferase family 4 protein [Lentisphaeria bacterium]